jgi:hypothetical protein
MNPADKFNPGKWLVENKLTNQSRLDENEHAPYQFDDERSKELYKKYNKSLMNPAWKGDSYKKEIKLDTLLKITGMTLDELKELNTYSDESWSLNINENEGIVTEFND